MPLFTWLFFHCSFTVQVHKYTNHTSEQMANFCAGVAQGKQALLKMASSSNPESPVEPNLPTSVFREIPETLLSKYCLIAKNYLGPKHISYGKQFQHKQALHIQFDIDWKKTLAFPLSNKRSPSRLQVVESLSY